MKENIVFDYLLTNAWCLPLCRVSVSEDGMVQYQNGRDEEHSLKLEKVEIEKIKEIVSRHSQILDYKSQELESPDVFDGVMNFFEVEASDGRKVHLMAFNIGEVKTTGMSFSKGLMEESKPDEVVVPVKAKEVVRTFEEIAAVLVANGVDTKCLRLTYA